MKNQNSIDIRPIKSKNVTEWNVRKKLKFN